MTIEEKAEAYDKALEIAKKNYYTAQDLCSGTQIGVECFKNTLAHMFPKLKDDEDENIKKEIINYFKCLSREEPSRKYIHNKWIAWLEKQGKQKPIKHSKDDGFESGHAFDINQKF